MDRVRGFGVQTATGTEKLTRKHVEGKLFAAGRPYQKPEQFLTSYAHDISSLPEPYNHAASYLDGLGVHERDVWTTMLPAAAAFRREAGDHSPEPYELLAKTRAWCATIVQDELNRVAKD